MTSMNEEAEKLMRRIEQAEEKEKALFEVIAFPLARVRTDVAVQDGEIEKQSYHLCIVNLVIGTLYCAKGNFEFGISRVMKSLEPYQKKVICFMFCS